MTGGMICPFTDDATSTAPAFSGEKPTRFIIGMVKRLQVPVHHQVLVRVLHGPADLLKQTEAVVDREVVPAAVIRQGHAVDIFHDEIGSAVFGDPAIEQPGNVLVAQAAQDLPFGQEAAQYGIGIHASFDELEDYFLFVRAVGPFGQVDRAHPAPAYLLKDLVGTKLLADQRGFRLSFFLPKGSHQHTAIVGGLFEQRLGRGIGGKQGLDLRT